tara:strand:- start:61 stop:336 length:276 start_codon:yes stop_codon:yes gene_type:complete
MEVHGEQYKNYFNCIGQDLDNNIMAQENGDWREYKKLVISEIDRLSGHILGLEKKIDHLRGDVVMLKVKSGMWGLLAGLIPVTIALLTKSL